MQNRWNWIGKSAAALVGVVTLIAPEVIEARDRCGNRGNQGYYNEDSRSYNRGRQYQENYYNHSYNSGSWGNRSYPSGNAYSGYGYGDYRERPAGQSAAIIGGSAAAGAGIGAIAGGKKGALIGAGVGAVGGLIYDRATKDNGRVW